MYYFAWVNSSETTFDAGAHARTDEQIVSLEIEQSEGDFATASIEIQNPRVGLLAASRKQWAWIARDDGDTAGPTAIFFGRLLGMPTDLNKDLITIEFVARPIGFEHLKASLAFTLKVAPYWDPVWIAEGERDDPDVVLESRCALWHIDRVTHEVTISDSISGEDGTLNFGTSDILADSVSVAYGEGPLDAVKVQADVSWEQVVVGDVDLTQILYRGFQAAGSGPGIISSYTGGGLYEDWPKNGDNIGSGWTVGATEIKYVSGKTLPDELTETFVTDNSGNKVKGSFRNWAFVQTFIAHYDATRSRKETIEFTLRADVQDLFTAAGDEDITTINLSSSAIVDLIDDEGTSAIMPVRDLRRRDYFNTDRGKQSLEYLICLARAQLLQRSRAVEVTFSVPLDRALSLSCRQNVQITDPRLPGGSAAGKVISYRLRVADGSETADINIGCMVGNGATVTQSAGTPTYVESGYVDDGYQQRDAETVMPIAGEVTYDDFFVLPNDDGLDFMNMRGEDAVYSFSVTNGSALQRAVVKKFNGTLEAKVSAVNDYATTCTLTMYPLDVGPFETAYNVSVSSLMIPKTIDLEAAS